MPSSHSLFFSVTFYLLWFLMFIFFPRSVKPLSRSTCPRYLAFSPKSRSRIPVIIDHLFNFEASKKLIENCREYSPAVMPMIFEFRKFGKETTVRINDHGWSFISSDVLFSTGHLSGPTQGFFLGPRAYAPHSTNRSVDYRLVHRPGSSPQWQCRLSTTPRIRLAPSEPRIR